jgi:hybrid cluster-associated redox disulfide protein
MADNNKVNKDMVIGEIVSKYPQAEKVIQKHFGSGCFTCPGMKVESISFGAMMHNMNVDDIVNEINASIENK